MPIWSDADIVAARQLGRALATQLGLGATELILIATALSELEAVKAALIAGDCHAGIVDLGGLAPAGCAARLPAVSAASRARALIKPWSPSRARRGVGHGRQCR